jgi:lipopolysaccharide transport system ATP-binding protein
MSDIAIRVEKLGKQYRIGAKRERYSTLRDRLATAFSAPWRSLSGAFRNPKSPIPNPQSQIPNPQSPIPNPKSQILNPNSDTIWALKDVSFEVKRGEVVGIIGRNGAGKSTLLKILSRITEPTEGYAEVHGRVGSLLEVGTGFHPELTGGENIYLNGAILGMKRTEIEAKFDEIVAFAEVEKFIDTPVKHYSGGMYLRLAFAVAAHLDPEILLVDEVLAVGDAQFQKKCLGKMEEVAQQGRTVLFVSHNMAAVRSLCLKGLLLKGGRLCCFAQVQEALHRYNALHAAPSPAQTPAPIEFSNTVVANEAHAAIRPGDAFEVGCQMHVRFALPGLRLFCIIHDADGVVAVHQRADAAECSDRVREGTYRIRAQFPPLWLRPGVYSVQFKAIANCLSNDKGRFVSDAVLLDVSDALPSEALLGYVTPAASWDVQEETATSGGDIQTLVKRSQAFLRET